MNFSSFFKRPIKAQGGKHAELPIYGWHQGRVFTNGGQQFGFEFHKTLPLYSVIGPATNAGFLASRQPPQVWNPQSVGTVGLGGLQAGSLASQPLVNSDFSPVE
jgi:hypothetical protein